MKSEPEGWEGFRAPNPTNDRNYASEAERRIQATIQREYYELRDLGWEMIESCPRGVKFLAFTVSGVSVCSFDGSRFWADSHGFIMPIVPFAWKPMPST